jgi:hypothetical protein
MRYCGALNAPVFFFIHACLECFVTYFIFTPGINKNCQPSAENLYSVKNLIADFVIYLFFISERKVSVLNMLLPRILQ